MKCPSEVELNEYAEDRLPTARRWQVEAHLRDCPGCRTDLEGLSWVTAALGALEAEETGEASHPPLEDLAALREGRLPALRRAEVLSHIGACSECAEIYGHLPREQRAASLVRHWQPLAAAASLLLVVGLVFFLARGQFAPGAIPKVPAVQQAEMSRPAAPLSPAAGDSAVPGKTATTAKEPPHAAPRPRIGRRAVEQPQRVQIPGRSRRSEGTRPRPGPVKGRGEAVVAETPPLPAPVPAPLLEAVAERMRAPAPAMKTMTADAAAGYSGPTRGATFRAEGGGRTTPGGVTAAKDVTDRAHVAAVNRLLPSVGAMDRAKPTPPAPVAATPAPVAAAPTMSALPGMPGAPAGPAGAAAAATPRARTTAGAGMPPPPPATVASPSATAAVSLLMNRVPPSDKWLQDLRNDPVRKAQVKALLREMLRQEKDGGRREAMRRALLVLEPPARL